jgi:8-oxo-dGTP pyrophosphatase MutT (NUDIX family)
MSMFSFFGGGDKKDKAKEESAKPSKPQHPCSPNDYIAASLLKEDADHFAAAGILVFDSKAPASIDLLLGRNSSKNEIEILGGKRDDGEDVVTTAAREFDEETGGVLGDIKKDHSHRLLLMTACRESAVFWHARGRYALFLIPAFKLRNLVVFDPPADSLPKRHRAFLQSGKAKSKSFAFREMQEIMWLPFANLNLPHGQKSKEFTRSVFDCAVFRVWLNARLYGQPPYTLLVSGLDWNTRHEDVLSLFQQVGPCSVKLEPHQDSSLKTSGNATIFFQDCHHAASALSLFQGSTYGGRPLIVTWPRSQDPSSALTGQAAGALGASAEASHAVAHPHASTLYPSRSTPHVSSGAPHVSSGAPHVSSGAPHVSSAAPHVSSAAPHSSSAAPCTRILPPPPPPQTSSGALPTGWIEQRISDGTPFYVYTPNGFTTWDRPPSHTVAAALTPPTHVVASPSAHSPVSSTSPHHSQASFVERHPAHSSVSSNPPHHSQASFMERDNVVMPPPAQSTHTQYNAHAHHPHSPQGY